MKNFKIISIFCAVIIAALVVAVTLLTSSGLQTKIAASILSDKFPQAKIAYVKMGLSQMRADGLELPLPDGTKIDLKSATIEYSALDLLADEINVTKLLVEGAEIKLADKNKQATPSKLKNERNASTQTQSTGSATQNAPAKGAENIDGQESLLKTLSAWSLFVGDLKIGAKILDASGAAIETSISLQNLNIKKGLKPVSGIAAIDVTAYAKNFAKESISARASVKEVNDGSQVAVEIKRKNSRIAAMECVFGNDFSAASSTIRLDVSDADIEALKPILGEIPSFKSSFFAKVKYADFGKTADIEGVFKNEFPNPAQLNATLDFLSACELSGEISASLQDGFVNIAKLEAIAYEGAKSIVSINLPNPVKVPLSAKNAAEIAQGNIECTIAVPSKIPAKFAKGIDFSSSDICGKVSAAFIDGKIAVKTISPFTVSALSISKNGEDFVKNIGATLDFDLSSTLKGDFDASATLTAGDTIKDSATLKILASKIGKKITSTATLKGSIDPFATKIYSVANLEQYHISLDCLLQGTYEGQTISVEKFDFLAFDKDGKQMAKISDGGKFLFDLQNKRLESPSKILATFAAKDFPFSPIKPFAAGVDAQSVSVSGKLTIVGKSSLSLDSTAEIKSLYYKKNGETLVADISAKTLFEVLASENGEINAQIKQITFSSGGTQCAFGNAQLETALKPSFLLKSLKADLTTSLPALLDQPSLTKFANVATGNLHVNLDVTASKITARTRIDNLKTRSAEGTLDNVSATLEAPFGKNFAVSKLVAELTAKSIRGQTDAIVKIDFSDILKIDFDAKSAVVEDAMLLSKAFANPNADAAKAARENAATGKRKIVRPQKAVASQKKSASKSSDIFAPKDSKAFWYIGRKIDATAKVGTILMDARPILSNANAVFKSDATSLWLDLSKASLLGSSLSGKLSASFDSSASIPYKISTFSANLKNLQAAKIFAKAKKPLVEGIFSAHISAIGSGNNASHLLQYLVGEASLTSSGGRLNLLDSETAAGATANLAGTALKITGAILKKDNNVISGAGDLISYFARLDYNSIDFKITRNSKTYNFNFDSAAVKTSDLLINAAGGEIIFNPNTSLSNYELDIPMNIFVYDTNVRKIFTSAGFAKTKSKIVKNAYAGPSFKIYGTVSNPKNNLLQVLLGRSSGENSNDSATAIRNLGGSILNSLLN